MQTQSEPWQQTLREGPNHNITRETTKKGAYLDLLVNIVIE